jgi:hypothetical protein
MDWGEWSVGKKHGKTGAETASIIELDHECSFSRTPMGGLSIRALALLDKPAVAPIYRMAGN